MAKTNSKFNWQDKVINHAQIGGIETSVLDNGLGKGSRIAWVNTGSGLRYKVVLDRALDITEAFYNQHSLSWIGHAGATCPRPDANKGLEWLYGFTAGLVTTCGLTHYGPPETDNSEERGLHGRISNIPAMIESIVQPDIITGRLEMSITGIMKESRLFGPNLELRRTISATLGEPTIRIHDVVTNAGNTKCPHMLLYHCNFGWPLVDEGTELVWKGKFTTSGGPLDGQMFNEKRDYHKCMPPVDSHLGSGQALAFIDVAADKNSLCTIGLYNRKLALAVAMKYSKKQLPWLSNWQHWGKGEYVTGMEPGTNPPIGQNKARERKELIYIAPGKSKTYDLEITVLANEKKIESFIKTAGE